MKLTVAIKLLPTKEQALALEDTLRETNAAANAISEFAWSRRSFGQYKLHELCYHDIRARFGLSAQIVIRTIAKVADAYRSHKQRKCNFKSLGAIAYDDRILRYYETEVSIWTTKGRERVQFVCDERGRKMLSSRKGESDLLYREGKWYLLATVNLEEPFPRAPEDWLGVDLGIKNVAVDSDGESYSSSHLKGLRRRYYRVRTQLQAKGTKSAKRLLKKRRRKERRMGRNVNHRISKGIVRKAQDSGRGIALEDLKGIRERITVSKPQRRMVHSWSFHQLSLFIEYKAKLAGVPMLFVDPRYTSKTCPACGFLDKRNRHSRDIFRCVSCSFAGEADTIAAANIRSRAVVNQPDAAHLLV